MPESSNIWASASASLLAASRMASIRSLLADMAASPFLRCLLDWIDRLYADEELAATTSTTRASVGRIPTVDVAEIARIPISAKSEFWRIPLRNPKHAAGSKRWAGGVGEGV